MTEKEAGMRVRALEREEVSWWLRPLYALLIRRFGKILAPYKVWAYRPGTLLSLTALMASLDLSRVGDPRIQRLASTRAAQLVACPF